MTSRLSGTSSAPHPSVAGEPASKDQSGNVPVSFEANRGQTDDQVRFLARTGGYSLFLTPEKAVFALAGQGDEGPGAAVHMSFLGANASAKVTGTAPLAGKVNYLNNVDPAQRRTNIPTFGKVSYEAVYPGIDLAYYGNGSELEYDFIVAPGADPGAIRLGIEGTDGLRLDDSGNLVMSTAAGELIQHKPVLYQESDGARRPVEGSFTLDENRVGFAVGAYDARRPLVIDPTLAYSTILDDDAAQVEVDAEGHAYVAGLAYSPADFPTTPGALQRTANTLGVPMAYVQKFNPNGTGLVYSTLVATAVDGTVDLALAPDGSVWVAASNAFVNDVPVSPGAFQTALVGSEGAFLVHLSADGSTALYGTYVAVPDNSGRLTAGGIALDPSGDVWMTASVGSLPPEPPFPTTAGAIQPLCDVIPGRRPRCATQVLLVRFNPGGNGLGDVAYATWLPGNGMSSSHVELNSDGTLHVFGLLQNGTVQTTSNALHPNALGGNDLYLMRVLPAGNGPSDLLYSSYLGGSGSDGSGTDHAMTVGPDDIVYVAYTTDSFDIPITPGAFQPFPRSLPNIVVQRIDTGAGSTGLLYSTYFAGDGSDRVGELKVDGRSHVYLTGIGSFNFPTRNPLACCAFSKGPHQHDIFSGDAFLLELNPAGQGIADLVFSTFLGGSTAREIGRGIALSIDTAGRARFAHVVGRDASLDFPVTPGAYRTTVRPGTRAGFLSKIDFSDQFPCTRTVTGNVAGGVVAGFGEIVCVTNASVTNGVAVQPGGEVRIQDSRISGSIGANQAAAFTLCGTSVTGSVAVTGTAPVFVTTTGTGCPANRILGTTTLPGGTSPPTTTTTIQPTTTTTIGSTTTTTVGSTTTTTAATNCAALRQQRQAFNAAVDGAQAGQDAATVAVLEQHRARQNAMFDQLLSGCDS